MGMNDINSLSHTEEKAEFTFLREDSASILCL